MSLTWHEFKSKVDNAIREAGATGDIEIEYIDTGAFPNSADIFVCPLESYVQPPGKWETMPVVQG